MSLSRKLQRLEVVVRARAEDAAPASWTDERAALWRSWIERIVATMPEAAARHAIAELWTLDRAAWGPIATRCPLCGGRLTRQRHGRRSGARRPLGRPGQRRVARV